MIHPRLPTLILPQEPVAYCLCYWKRKGGNRQIGVCRSRDKLSLVTAFRYSSSTVHISHRISCSVPAYWAGGFQSYWIAHSPLNNTAIEWKSAYRCKVSKVQKMVKTKQIHSCKIRITASKSERVKQVLHTARISNLTGVSYPEALPSAPYCTGVLYTQHSLN